AGNECPDGGARRGRDGRSVLHRALGEAARASPAPGDLIRLPGHLCRLPDSECGSGLRLGSGDALVAQVAKPRPRRTRQLFRRKQVDEYEKKTCSREVAYRSFSPTKRPRTILRATLLQVCGIKDR